MEFPESVVCDEEVTPVMFGATYARGSFDDQHSVILLHFPAENTDRTLFVFRLTEDKRGVDLLREQLYVRQRGAPTPDMTISFFWHGYLEP